MYLWNNIETKTELEFIFGILKENIKNFKIKRIFSIDDGIPKILNSEVIYDSLSDPIYILFENDYCLIIDFIFYSSICIEYRKIKSDELERSISNVEKKEIDYFNNHHEVYSWDFDDNNNRIEKSFRVKSIIDISGEYDEILELKVNGFHNEYDKWINNGDSASIIKMPSGGDYFNSIRIVLKNGIEIDICPQPAEYDGYYDLIIKDTNHCINYKQIEN